MVSLYCSSWRHVLRPPGPPSPSRDSIPSNRGQQRSKSNYSGCKFPYAVHNVGRSGSHFLTQTIDGALKRARLKSKLFSSTDLEIRKGPQRKHLLPSHSSNKVCIADSLAQILHLLNFPGPTLAGH